MGFVRRYLAIIVIAIIIASVAIYSELGSGAFCAVDYDTSYRFRETSWIIREVGKDCSALNSEFEISAVNKNANYTIPLFFIDGDASTALTFNEKGVVLLVDKFADIKQQGKSFGEFSAEYRRATDTELRGAPKLVEEKR